MRRLSIVVPALMLMAAAPPALLPAVPPVTRACVDLRQIRDSRMGPGTYDVRIGRDWWRNTAECPALAATRTIITRTPTGRLCRGDIAEIVDAVSRFNFGGCGLGNWAKMSAVKAAGGG